MIYEKPRILSATEARVAELQAFLRKSPSLVYPEDVIPYVDAVDTEVIALQAENAKLRELLQESFMPVEEYAKKYGLGPSLNDVNKHLDARLREVGIEGEE